MDSSLEGLVKLAQNVRLLDESREKNVDQMIGSLESQLRSEEGRGRAKAVAGRQQNVQMEELLTEVMTERLLASKSQRGTEGGAMSRVIANTLNKLNDAKGHDVDAYLWNDFLSEAKKLSQPKQKTLMHGHAISAQDARTIQKRIEELDAEFSLRRNLLSTRFNATVKSFLWSEKGKKEENKILEFLNFELRKPSSLSCLLRLLTASEEDCYVKKVSSISGDQPVNSLKKVSVGKVPDRGGRPSEQAPPPPEMPSWSQRQNFSNQGGGHRGGSGGRGGYRGGGGGGHRGGGGGHRGGGGGHRGHGRVQDGRWKRGH